MKCQFHAPTYRLYEITMYFPCLLTYFHDFSVYSISGTYVPNWSISRNYKNIWNSTKYSVTTQMFVTRRPHGTKPQVKGAQGPAGHTLSRFGLELGGYVHTSVHKSILCPRVGGNCKERLAGHVDGRPAIHHLQTDSIKSVEAPLYPYIRILMVEFTHTTLFL
jgi:hypothetical protein